MSYRSREQELKRLEEMALVGALLGAVVPPLFRFLRANWELVVIVSLLIWGGSWFYVQFLSPQTKDLSEFMAKQSANVVVTNVNGKIFDGYYNGPFQITVANNSAYPIRGGHVQCDGKFVHADPAGHSQPNIMESHGKGELDPGILPPGAQRTYSLDLLGYGSDIQFAKCNLDAVYFDEGAVYRAQHETDYYQLSLVETHLSSTTPKYPVTYLKSDYAVKYSGTVTNVGNRLIKSLTFTCSYKEYSDLDSAPFHEHESAMEVDLKPGQTISIDRYFTPSMASDSPLERSFCRVSSVS